MNKKLPFRYENVSFHLISSRKTIYSCITATFDNLVWKFEKIENNKRLLTVPSGKKTLQFQQSGNKIPALFLAHFFDRKITVINQLTIKVSCRSEFSFRTCNFRMLMFFLLQTKHVQYGISTYNVIISDSLMTCLKFFITITSTVSLYCYTIKVGIIATSNSLQLSRILNPNNSF